jgi:nicotinate-nucleotide--dimethylbenzimidazole phosphoribosyltransferase
MRRAEQVRDGRRRAIGLREQPAELLAELGEPALAAAAGFVLQAAVRRTPVLVDGTGAAAAALVAYQAQPRVVRWLVSAGTTPDPAHALAVTTMGLRCLLDLDVDTGDGTAGLAAIPLLRTAARLAAQHAPATPAEDESSASSERSEFAAPAEEGSDDA